MSTAKRKGDARPKPRRRDGASLVGSSRSQDAAVRSVIPDDVLRNLENARRHTTRVPTTPRRSESRFAC